MSEHDRTPQRDFEVLTNAGSAIDMPWPPTDDERVAAALHRAGVKREQLPPALREKVLLSLPGASGTERKSPSSRFSLVLGWGVGLAALIALATTLVLSSRSTSQLKRHIDALQAQLREQTSQNTQLLQASRDAIARLESETRDHKTRELELAQMLADATARAARLQTDLDTAQLRIATLEAPIDPATIKQQRTKLLEMPGTIRIAWSPFNVDGLPEPEQPGIQGDVIWNDESKQGYLRFVGLKPNDPNVEQYQVWVIDERGMEQKVSGGVFNASAEGEIIVPITPAIKVGRVALFAVTVEKPGGTWVPDLKRRIVVAPRGS